MKLLPLALLVLMSSSPAVAEHLLCHTTYGGETQTHRIAPVSSPYAVAGVHIGSYFLFRPVFQNAPIDLASIKLYTYVDRDGGPAMIHQASYAYPPRPETGGRHGFTGLQRVYEPVRDSELEFWCEMEARS
ncbi:MAG: hypothetical protein EG825_11725 [Rhodocyclaceae bacterium]|nr:hypothetical protein [Rhodocyclaceae bacterium]